VNWLRPGSTISLGLELQPFEVPVSFVDESFRALYLFPSYELRGDRAALGLGIGLAAARLTGSPLGDRTEWGTVTGLSLSVALRADFSLEVGWRNTGDMGGFKSSIWLTRVAWTWDR
jgi:hypothetical protein